jgi:hypothetical protein
MINRIIDFPVKNSLVIFLIVALIGVAGGGPCSTCVFDSGENLSQNQIDI